MEDDIEGNKPEQQVKKSRAQPKRVIKKHFITGIIAILPIFITVLIFWFLIKKIGGGVGHIFVNIPYLKNTPDFILALIGFFILLLIIYIIGAITSSVVGRWVLKVFESFIKKLPLIRTIYSSARELTNSMFISKTPFEKVVLIPYPNKYSYALAFLTNEKFWTIDNKKYLNIFIPTSPNPTSGYYLMYPSNEIIRTEIPVEWAFRIIVSGGMLLPEERNVSI